MEYYLNMLLGFLKQASLGEWLVLVAGFPLILYSIVMCFAFWWKSRPIQGPNRWYLYLMLAYLLGFIWLWMVQANVFEKHPFFCFIPINFLLWVGPVLFQFAKSKLYVNFRFKGNDLKHFLIPLAHFSFYGFAFLLPEQQKLGLYNQEYHDLYKVYETASFGLLMFLYCYFAYRFVKHEHWSMSVQTPRAEIIKILWLKRFLKLFFIASWVHLFYGLFSIVDAFFLKWSIKHNYLEFLNMFVIMVCLGWLGFHAVLMKALPKTEVSV